MAMDDVRPPTPRPAILPLVTDDGAVAYALSPDPDRDVQVATAADLEPRSPLPDIVPDRDVFCLRPRGAMLAVALVAAMIASAAISWLTMIPTWMTLIVVLVAMGLVMAFSPPLRATMGLALPDTAADAGPDAIPADAKLNPSFRVRLRVDLNGARTVGPIVDGPFEPEVHHAAFAMHNPVGVYMWCFVAVLGGVCWFGWWMLTRGMLPRVPYVPALTFQLYGLIAIALAALPFYGLFPTYYRVSPGLLEVLRYRPFIGGRPRIQRIDLRRVRVLVDLVNARLVIEENVVNPRTKMSSPRTTHLDMGPSWAMDRVGFARSVIIASRWQGELPETSKEALSG
jgi:hypothetical protein